MRDQPDNLVLVHLRRIDEDVQRVAEDIRNVKMRTTSMEARLASVNRRLDRLGVGVGQIKRHLDQVQA